MKSSFQQKLQIAILGFALILVFTGCTQMRQLRERVLPTGAEPEPPKKPTYYGHTVRWTGESLSIIAKWYTGSSENWKGLAKANPKINPSRIYIGQKIRIPENLLKTREPMPQSFVASFGPKKKKSSPPSEPATPPPSDEKEPTLFGPKPYPKK
jgi:LysM repeat protein